MSVLPRVALALLLLTLAACAPSGPSSSETGRQSGQAPGQSSTGPKTLVIAINEDPGSFWDGITGGGGGGARQLGHLTNQYLVALKADATPEVRLLAELPTLQNGLWTVAPDGTMQVTWKLRPGVTWHDGTALTADDIVFSWQVNRDPDVPNGGQAAVKMIDRMEARDPLTVVTSWSESYPYADRLEHREFIPVPKHILERHYTTAKDQLLFQPYFSSEYVGLGPYRVERWERGSHLDLVAYDGYFLGRAMIDRIRVQFISDENAVIANLQAGSVHTFLPAGGPSLEQFMALKQDWEASKRGSLITESVRWFFAEPQKAPARNPQPASLTDPRVRQALLYAIDRQELTNAVLGDLGIVADSWVHPSFPYHAQMQSALTKYQFDPRRATQMLTDMGWRRGADGVLERGTEKFNMQLRYRETEKEATIIRDNWKEIGVNGMLEYQSDQQLRDREARARFTGVDVSNNPMGTLSAVRRLIGDATPTPENRWTGTNRGGYMNSAWDDIGEQLRVTLDSNRQIELERDLVRVFSTELPVLPIYYEVQVVPTAAGLTGVQGLKGIAHTGHVMHTWNVHEWDLQR